MKKKHLSEEELIEKFQKSEIGWLEYVTNLSQEWDEEFTAFLKENGLEATDDSAQRFLQYKKEKMEQGLEEGTM